MTAARLLIAVLAMRLAVGNLEASLRERRKRTNIALESEADVDDYLSTTGRGAAIWRCKNQVLVQWHAKVVPYFDVECEVLGDVQTVEWLRNKKAIVPGTSARYTVTSLPHVKHGQRFQRWLHYKLRVHWATEDDSGVYVLRVAGPRDATAEERRVHARIVTEHSAKQAAQGDDGGGYLPATTAAGTRAGLAASQKQRQRRLKTKSRRERATVTVEASQPASGRSNAQPAWARPDTDADQRSMAVSRISSSSAVLLQYHCSSPPPGDARAPDPRVAAAAGRHSATYRSRSIGSSARPALFGGVVATQA